VKADPIKVFMQSKGIVFDIKKYSIHDGPGIRTTVFFKGCPLFCWWCHNPESQRIGAEVIEKINRRKCLDLSYAVTRENIGREVTVEEIIREIEKDTVFYDESRGGVTFSGGEPLMQPDFLHALARECKIRDIHTAVDTSGYAASEVVKKIVKYIDLFLYDLKIMDDTAHKTYAGVSNRIILENLKLLAEMKKEVVIRFPIVPGFTDAQENIDGMIRFLNSLKTIQQVSLLAFNHLGNEKYKRLGMINRMEKVPVPTTERMDEIRRLFEKKGFRVTIGG
jgi:pyruvate formate lyase activating enzyme